MGWGGIITSKALVAFSVVDWLLDHLLVGRSQKENASDLREMLVKILSKMTLRRRRRRATLWCMCATALRAGSRSFRVGSRKTSSFQYGSLVHPKWACFRCKYRTSSWRLSWRRCCCPSGREWSPSIHVHLVLTNLTAVLSGRVDENPQEAFQQVRVRGGFCLPTAVACLGQGPEADDLDVHRQILGHPSSW